MQNKGTARCSLQSGSDDQIEHPTLISEDIIGRQSMICRVLRQLNP